MSERDRVWIFVGPLGLWPWPLVNLLLSLAIRLRYYSPLQPVPYAQPPPPQRPTVYEVERWGGGGCA